MGAGRTEFNPLHGALIATQQMRVGKARRWSSPRTEKGPFITGYEEERGGGAGLVQKENTRKNAELSLRGRLNRKRGGGGGDGFDAV